MKLEKVVETYQYNLPYTKKDVKDIYELAYNQALMDVLLLVNGEVIGGTLKAMIDAEKVKELLK